MTKSDEFKSVFLNGQTSRPIGIHLVNIRCKTASSEANLPTLPSVSSTVKRQYFTIYSLWFVRLNGSDQNLTDKKS